MTTKREFINQLLSTWLSEDVTVTDGEFAEVDEFLKFKLIQHDPFNMACSTDGKALWRFNEGKLREIAAYTARNYKGCKAVGQTIGCHC